MKPGQTALEVSIAIFAKLRIGAQGELVARFIQPLVRRRARALP